MKATVAQYYPGRSLMHRLDPRAKFIAVTSLAIALFVRDSFASLAVLGVAAAVADALSRVPVAWFWRAFRPLLWLVALTFIAQLIVAPGTPFFNFWFVNVSWAGIELATFLSACAWSCWCSSVPC